MALRGSLADMNVGDVLQLPTMGARTGELRLEHDKKQASIFYKEGRIVHVTLGALRDDDAMVELLGWQSGEFLFDQDVKPPAETITEDLHRLLMRTAKKRDEEKRKTPAAPAPKGGIALNAPEVDKLLEEALAGNKGFSVMAFVSKEGKELNASPKASPLVPVASAFAKACFTLAEGKPRSAVRRTWVEDDDGHCLWLRLGNEVSLVILAAPSVNMGVLMLAATKVGTNLKHLVQGAD